MKFALPVLALSSLGTGALSGQTNTFPASGNVGIGTTNPQSRSVASKGESLGIRLCCLKYRFRNRIYTRNT